MTEYPFIIDRALGLGLSPDSPAPRNGNYMQQMANARPMFTPDQKPYALSVDPIANPTSETAGTWPHPSIERGENVTLIGRRAGLKSVDASWGTTVITTYDSVDPSTERPISPGGRWHLASAQDIWAMCNGVNLVFSLPSNSDGKALTVDPAVLSCKACAMYDDAIALAGLDGTWLQTTEWGLLMDAWRETQGEEQFAHEDLAFDSRWVICAEPKGGAVDIPNYLLLCALGCFGAAKFAELFEAIYTAFEERRIWMMPVRSPGSVLGLQPMGARLAVLGTNGVTEIYRSEQGRYFVEEPQTSLGVIGRGAFRGNDKNQYAFLSNEGFLHLRTLQSGIKNLGFNHLLSGMGSDTVVSYDPGLDEYYVCNGTTGYLMQSDGRVSGPLDARPTGLFRDSAQGLVGIVPDPQGYIEIRMQSCRFDMGSPGSKHVPMVYFSNRNMTTQSCRIDWAANTERVGINPGRTVPLNRKGVCFPGQSFVDGELYYQGVVASGETASIGPMEIRYHAEERMRRGPSAASQTGEQQ